MKRKEVKSSNIKSIGYNPKTKTLEVEFERCVVYQYFDVPTKIHEDLMKAESIGSFFSKNIKSGIYKYRKLDVEKKI